MDVLERLGASLQEETLTVTKLVDDTGVLLDVDSLQVFSLNETGMFVVEEVGRGLRDRRRLVERIVGEFEVDEAAAQSDLEGFLSELEAVLPTGDGGSVDGSAR
jgi:hypothetical protein